jgi:hypothetical protein
MFVLGLTATSALAALPDLHIALGEEFPVTAHGEDAAAVTTLSSAGGSVLTGKGVDLLVEWKELSSLGTFDSNFTNVVMKTKKCKSGTDVAGTVLVKGPVHLVFVQLTPKLVVGVLYLFEPIEISCEGVKIKCKGSVLGTYEGELNKDITKFSGSVLGSKGVQEKTKYWNQEGTAEVEDEPLLCDPGTGFVKSAQNIDLPLTLTANKMIEILG